jgi:hypothetical protein
MLLRNVGFSELHGVTTHRPCSELFHLAATLLACNQEMGAFGYSGKLSVVFLSLIRKMTGQYVFLVQCHFFPCRVRLFIHNQPFKFL